VNVKNIGPNDIGVASILAPQTGESLVADEDVIVYYSPDIAFLIKDPRGCVRSIGFRSDTCIPVVVWMS
jgi:hypothetical protein